MLICLFHPSPIVPLIPVLFAIRQQGWTLSPRAFCANIGVPAGHHAGREVVLQEGDMARRER
jgi:hypothetical protein